MSNAGIDLLALSPRDLARQAMVLYVDGGQAAADKLDEIEEHYQAEIQREIDDAAGIFDDMTMPEGMTGLAGGYMGVIPSGG